jgi:hypothetical protein
VSFAKPVSRLLSIVFICTVGVLSSASAVSATGGEKPRKASTEVFADAADVTGGIAGMTSSSDAEAVCTKVRRRLWVEGEGWVVRRVGQCR